MKRALFAVTVAWTWCACSSGGQSQGAGGDAASGSESGLGVSGGGDDSIAGQAGSAPAMAPAAAPLVVEALTPDSEASEVPLDAVIEIRFGGALDPATATASNILVEGPNGPLAGELTVDADRVSFTPAAALPLLTPVRVTLTLALTSTDGGALVSPSKRRLQPATAFFDSRFRSMRVRPPVSFCLATMLGTWWPRGRICK